MAVHLPVPLSLQQRADYCLPACTEMVLNYLGIAHSQNDLARLLDVVADFGAPASNITRLTSRSLEATYFEECTLQEIKDRLTLGNPVIAFVQTEQLAYWRGYPSQHAVVVVGADIETLYILDPTRTALPIPVPVDEFMLAWDEMGFSCAVIQKRR